MARKRGLFGLLVVLILYVLSGIIVAYLVSIVDSHFPDLPGKSYLISGIAAGLGFIYWFVVLRLAGKSIKKLITG